ncbi:glycosyltransferase [Candidatus Woesearchaeota archaeon]|nr:glycosyltransferase [Candidatus Woesearchaeota archaeon]
MTLKPYIFEPIRIMGYSRFKIKDFFPKLRETIRLFFYSLFKGNKILVAYSKKHNIFNTISKNNAKNITYIGPMFNLKENILTKFFFSKIDIIFEDGAIPYHFTINKPVIKYYEYYKKDPEKYVNKVITRSKFGKKNTKKDAEVIYPSIKIPKIEDKKKSKEINIFFSGSASYRKGVDILYEAFKRIKKKHLRYNLNLIMASVPFRIEAGNHAQNKKRMQEIYKECKKRKDTYFGPIYPNSLVHHFLRKTDIFVLPTRNDSFGFAILEAMSYSVPVITTNINAMPEIVQHNKNGFLINIKDYSLHERALNKKGFFEDAVDQLEKYLTILIENQELRIKMGGKSKNIIKEKFNIDKTKKRLKEIFEEVLEKN